MWDMQPHQIYITTLLLPPPMIERILENELSLDPKGVAR